MSNATPILRSKPLRCIFGLHDWRRCGCGGHDYCGRPYCHEGRWVKEDPDASRGPLSPPGWRPLDSPVDDTTQETVIPDGTGSIETTYTVNSIPRAERR